MEEDIKILEDFIEGLKQYNPKTGKNIEPLQFGEGQRYVYKNVYYAINHLIEAYKEKDKENNDLRILYRKTAEKLRENGKIDLADYFLAQINEIPTFTIDSDIDYYTEYYKFINGDIISTKQVERIAEKLTKHFIHIQVIKDEIEKLKKYKIDYKNKFKDNQDEDHYSYINAIDEQISILEELLLKVGIKL